MDFTEQIVKAFADHWSLIVGFALIGSWVVQTFFPGFFERKKGGLGGLKSTTQLVVQLDPEVSKAIHDTADNIKNVSEIVSRRDDSGVPLVYSDRRLEESIVKITEALATLADAQKRLAESMARLDARFEAHDKSDSITFSRLADTMVRIEQIAQANRDSMIGFSKDHAQALKALDDIRREHADHDARVMKAVALQEDIRNQMKK